MGVQRRTSFGFTKMWPSFWRELHQTVRLFKCFSFFAVHFIMAKMEMVNIQNEMILGGFMNVRLNRNAVRRVRPKQ